MKKKSRIDIASRVLALESFYGQKETAKLLKISTSTVRNYRDGKTKPKKEKIYNRLNRTYNKNKQKITPELIQQERIKIAKKKAITASKIYYAPIDPYFIDTLGLEDYGWHENSFKKLMALHELGYVSAWQGSRAIPLEVEFVYPGQYNQPLKNLDKIMVMIITTFGDHYGIKRESGYSYVYEYPIFCHNVKGLIKEKDAMKRANLIRDHVMSKQKAPKHATLTAYVGWYKI